ncbi:DinB family protein [Deinococcus sp.]|uniref:DinB family protein n=1 Tax=Deinococcus sp. TaxID=47478 RepID=UPI0025E6ED1A|nr:DinB family protein [Deinococcus sp.]
MTIPLADDMYALADALLGQVMDTARAIGDEGLNVLPAGLQNTAYTIVYHLLGSAGYWIGEVVGAQPTGRVRAEEFGTHGTLRELEDRYADTRARVDPALRGLDASALTPHPTDLSRGMLSWGFLPPQGRSDVWVVAHDLAHIGYHLGQLKLIEQLLANHPAG